MKIKRVIEIEESDYELSCQRYGDARYNGHQPDYENTAIAQSKPYNPSGDCISREALKEAMNEEALNLSNGGRIFIENINKIIDNAPTVSKPYESEADK